MKIKQALHLDKTAPFVYNISNDHIIKVVNENMPTDIRFKNDLRKERIMYREYLELLENGDVEKLKQKFKAEMERIEETLRD